MSQGKPIGYIIKLNQKQNTPFLFLLIFFFLALSGCTKPQWIMKPFPEKVPDEPLSREPVMHIEVNGQRISPLVPTLFLLPEEAIQVRTRRVSPSVLSCPESPFHLENVSLPTPPHQPVGYADPRGTGSQARRCLKTESWSLVLNGRTLPLLGDNLFSGKAPKEPGLYILGLECRQRGYRPAAASDSRVEEWEEQTRQNLLVIVLYPFSRINDGFIDQFPMGFYPNPEEAPIRSIPKTALPHYLPPKGFIEVTPENQGVLVSKTLRLQDFSCHYKTPFPHYMALSSALLLKLELLTLKLQQLGFPEARLTILSGFRTPWYNQTVSGALWSRHIYGDAADITLKGWLQEGIKEDMNQDGRIDREDLLVLAGLIEEIEAETGLVGGLGIYDLSQNGKYCPFIHVDTRGFKARW